MFRTAEDVEINEHRHDELRAEREELLAAARAELNAQAPEAVPIRPLGTLPPLPSAIEQPRQGSLRRRE